MKKLSLFLFTTFCFTNLQAQTTKCPEPDEDLIYTLCTEVKNGTPLNEGRYKYYYQKFIEEAACVHPNDTPEEAVRKVRTMWNRYKLLFACDIPAFNVSNGNVLKLSIDSTFTEFLKEMLRKYDLDVDFVDPADGKTLLQYINNEIEVASREGQSSKATELKGIKRLIAESRARVKNEQK